MVRFFLFLALAIVFDFSVGPPLSISFAAEPGNATPNALLQGPLLAPGSSLVVKENVNQSLPTAPGSSKQNEEATHSNLIDEVDEAVQLP